MRQVRTIAGVDEAGRGALAGPVVAAACVLLLPLTKLRCSPPRWRPKGSHNGPLIADSKILSPEAREAAFAWITAHCVYGIGMSSALDIDQHGILWATNKAMCVAVDSLRCLQEVDCLLVDGKDKFQFPVEHRSIVRGDRTEASIAAASIVAKVARDRLLRDAESIHADFRFSIHKGYGTPAHLAELRRFGPTLFHRSSFVARALEKPILRTAGPVPIEQRAGQKKRRRKHLPPGNVNIRDDET